MNKFLRSTIRRPVLLLGAAVGLFLIALLLKPARTSVSLTFLCYTNVDVYGCATEYTSGLFRLENHSSVCISYRQGPLEIERAGTWHLETNWTQQSYNDIVEPGKSTIVRSRRPLSGTRWRSKYLVMPIRIRTVSEIKPIGLLNNVLRRIPFVDLSKLPWNRNPSESVIPSDLVSL